MANRVKIGIAAVIALAAPQWTLAQADKVRPMRPDPRRAETVRVLSLEKLTAELSLTPEQVASLKPIEERVEPARRLLRERIESELAKAKAEAKEAAGADRKTAPDFQGRIRMAPAPARELEEEWLDAVAAVLTPEQRRKLAVLRDPPPAPVQPIRTAPSADSPGEQLAAKVREMDLTEVQLEKVRPALETMRLRCGEHLRTALEETEALLTTEQRQAAEKARKAKPDAGPEFLLQAVATLRISDEQKTKLASIRDKSQKGAREAIAAFRKEVADVLSAEQREKLFGPAK